MGRVPTAARNGPRVIDLDILFYDDVVMDSPTLTIPHPRMKERDTLFLRCPEAGELEPEGVFPSSFFAADHLLDQLMAPPLAPPTSVQKVMPIGKGNTYWKWGERTLIMGILNVTPDSFSDGGMYACVPAALRRARELVAAGADVIDVGGQSTRPGADDVGAEVEAARVVPVIRAIREAGLDVPVSVDTFRASVARAAAEAGADFVNDVSGGSRDPEMLPFVASAGLPVCLMHARGDSKTMAGMTGYAGGDVVGEIRRALRRAVGAALERGVRRWNV
ncbi:MAG: Dihydropteroate synthase-like protein, partial [Olpidium bornovanus]